VRWRASDCHSLLDWNARPAGWFDETEEFFDAVDEVHSQL
jgi:hypothetical protein